MAASLCLSAKPARCLAYTNFSDAITYTAPETLRKATGEDLNVSYYLDYLRGRFAL